MTEYLNFTVAETSGRTFELPLEKAVEIVKRMQEDEYFEGQEVNLEDSYEVANFIMNYALDDVAKYELSNDYLDLVLADSRITK